MGGDIWPENPEPLEIERKEQGPLCISDGQGGQKQHQFLASNNHKRNVFC